MSHSQPDTRTERNTDETDANTASTAPVIETQPTLKPTLISLTGVLVAGLAVVAFLFTTPTLLGTVERTEVAANLVAILTLIGTGRLVLRLYVLTKTRYVVTPNAVRREYSLLYKTFSRELPLARMRSLELRRSRIETLFGIGSVAFLTGSVAQSPAHVEFANVPDPEGIRGDVRDRLPSDTE